MILTLNPKKAENLGKLGLAGRYFRLDWCECCVGRGVLAP